MQDSGTILIADDDENDILLFQRALRTLGMRNPTAVVMSGLEVMDYFSGRNLYSKRTMFPLPELAFLDVKMPIYDCFDVLNWLRLQDEILQAIPIVVMSSSIRPVEQKKILELGAKAFCSKPLEGDRLKECLELFLTRADKS